MGGEEAFKVMVMASKKIKKINKEINKKALGRKQNV